MSVPVWVVNLSAWWMTGIMGIILYWVPLITCAIVYTVKGFKKYEKQRVDRRGDGEGSWKHFDESELTLGHIVGFTVICICPVVNLIAFMKECAWDTLTWIGKKFEAVFTAPLVKDSEKYKEMRQQKRNM